MTSSTLTQLLYVSCSRIPTSDVDSILASAERHNPQRGLTGALLFTGQYFFQILEGPDAEVEGMFKEISDDPRHHSIKLLQRHAIEAREFPDWKMGSVTLDAVDQLIAPLFTVSDPERSSIIAKMTLQALKKATAASSH